MGAGCTDEVIPDEVIKNCWRKAGILSFEVNQRYIEDKRRSVKAMLRCRRQQIILLIFLES